MMSSLTPPPTRFGYAIIAILACATFAFWFGLDWKLPGLYMDSINPEYLAAQLIGHGDKAQTPAPVLPGNYIAGKYPLLAGSYYHGPLQFYLALPVYALFGTDLVGARLMQGLYAVLILLAMSLVAKRYSIRLPIAAAMLILLAVDPTYSVAFKTQAYNVIWPMVWLLLAIAMTERWASAGLAPTRRQLFGAGLMLGIAFFCYFVFLLFVPALCWYLLVCLHRVGVTERRSRVRALALSAAGFAVGALPYVFGYALIYRASGDTTAFMSSSSIAIDKLLIDKSPLGWLQQVAILPRALFNALGETWIFRLVLRVPELQLLGVVKAALLLVSPLVLHLLLRLQDMRSRLLELCLALMLSYFLATLPFGAKISGHHYILFLPLLYLGIAAGLSDLWPVLARGRSGGRATMAILVVLGIGLAGYSVSAFSRFSSQLRSSGGAAYFSDAINRFSEQARSEDKHLQTDYYFPEWGFTFPFVFLTGAEVATRDGAPTPAEVVAKTCAGRGVRIVYWAATDASRLARDIKAVQPSLAPVIQPWKQRDGKAAFHVVSYAAQQASPSGAQHLSPMCPSS